MILKVLPIGMILLYINAAEISKRIRRGTAVKNGEYPFVGKFDAKWGNYQHGCTAILLDHETIISAAHCFCVMDLFPNNNINAFTVTFGSVNGENSSKQTSTLRKFYIYNNFYNAYKNNCSDLSSYKDPHPHYVNQIDEFTVFDIGIGKLSNSIKYTQNVKPIQLSNIEFTVRDKLEVHILGFTDGQLKRGTTKICGSLEYYFTSCCDCLRTANKEMIESIPEKGDSGGPVLALDKRFHGRVIAIVTSGRQRSFEKETSVGVYFPSYRIYDWVYKNTEFHILRE